MKHQALRARFKPLLLSTSQDYSTIRAGFDAPGFENIVFILQHIILSLFRHNRTYLSVFCCFAQNNAILVTFSRFSIN